MDDIFDYGEDYYEDEEVLPDPDLDEALAAIEDDYYERMAALEQRD